MNWRRILGPRILVTTGLGVAGGWIALMVGLPLPWMLGPMVASTVLALSGLPAEGPAWLRPFVIPVIGVMLGSSLTPEVLAAIPQWGFTMLLLVPFLAVAATLSYLIYRRFGRFDPVTAFFCSIPGGLNEMILFSEAHGGDQRKVALAHASRVLIVILCVSLFFGFVLGVTSGGGAAQVPMSAPSLPDWIILIGAGVLGVPLARALRLPAKQLLGPMILSGIAHASGLVAVAPPTLLVIVAQVVIGTTIGARFAGIRLRAVAQEMGLALVSSLVMIVIAVLFGWVVHLSTAIPIEQAFLAYTPGGLAEMSLLALALHQDVAYVAVTHVARIVLVIAGAMPAFRLMRGGSR